MVGSSCSSVDPVALQVGQWQLSNKDFQHQLNQYADAVAAAGASRSELEDATTGTWLTSFTASLLNQRLGFQLSKQAIADKGITVTDDDRTNLRSSLESSTSKFAKVFAQMSPELQDVYVEGIAAQQAYAADLVATGTTEDALRQVYDADPSQFDQACVSHILVLAGQADGQTTPSDDDYAAALQKIEGIGSQLDGTTNFAAVATASSEDSDSALQGGTLGCYLVSAFNVEGFKEAVASQPVGVVSDPVKSIYGYQLVLVTSRTPQAFDDVKSQIASKVQQAATQLTQAGLAKLAVGVDISVDGRYGQYDVDTAQIISPAGADQPSTPDTTDLLGSSAQ
jgi:parvulin-like peptidyl-prolyl isomerase